MLVLDLCWYCCSQYQETYQTCQYLVVSLHGALGIFCEKCGGGGPAAHQLCFCCCLQLWCICIKAKNASRIDIDQFVLKSQTFWTKMIADWDYSIFDFDRRHIYWLVLLFGQIRFPSLFLPNMGLLIYSFGLACFLAERLICIVASVSIITWIWSGSKKKTHS